MRKFQVLTVLAASTALVMGTVPAFAEDASVDVADAAGELPADEGAFVTYEDADTNDSGVVNGAVDTDEVNEELGTGEEVAVRNGSDRAVVSYMTGGPAGEEAGNSADQALDRVKVAANGNRTPATSE